MSVRPLVTAAAGAALLLTLTGCEKPTPGVTVSAGRHVVHMESTTFCHEGQSPEAQNCEQHLDRLGVVRVKQGQLVAIDVDKELAESGWILVDTEAGAATAVQDEHYFSYTPDFRNGPIVKLEVRSLDAPDPKAKTTGVWKFQLVQQ